MEKKYTHERSESLALLLWMYNRCYLYLHKKCTLGIRLLKKKKVKTPNKRNRLLTVLLVGDGGSKKSIGKTCNILANGVVVKVLALRIPLKKDWYFFAGVHAYFIPSRI